MSKAHENAYGALVQRHAELRRKHTALVEAVGEFIDGEDREYGEDIEIPVRKFEALKSAYFASLKEEEMTLDDKLKKAEEMFEEIVKSYGGDEAQALKEEGVFTKEKFVERLFFWIEDLPREDQDLDATTLASLRSLE